MNEATETVEKVIGDKKLSVSVEGMSCAGCAVNIESILKSAKGVEDAGVNYANQTVWIQYDEKETGFEALRSAIKSAGYDIIPQDQQSEDRKEEKEIERFEALKKRTLWSVILSLPVVAIGMFFMHMPYGNEIMMVLTAIILFGFGRSFFINAWKQALHKTANMDTLVALSTGVAFVYSTFNTFYPQYWESKGLQAHVYFEAAAVIIAFITLGKLLEERAKSKTSGAIKNLMGLQPKKARIVINNEEKDVAIGEVKPGDILRIRPGEKVPVDGLIVSGASFIDESMITGEPVPAEKSKGDKLFTGTINQKGSFTMEAQSVGSDTVLAQIIKMVQEAQGSKAPVQKLVDKIAGIFVPIVIVIAILSFAVWMLLGGEHAFSHALMAFMTVLVIACPCALGLATPTAVMVGIGKGASNNILIRDAESLEIAPKINAMVLDKTGTITNGNPEVVDIKWFSYGNEKELDAKLLKKIEQASEHPLAEAVVHYLKDVAYEEINIEDVESITGKGIKANHNGINYYAGNEKLMNASGIELSDEIKVLAQNWKSRAYTVIYFANNGQLKALIAIADQIKTGAAEAIASLHEHGIEVYMLTGDNQQTAKAVAERTGILHFEASVLPDDKEQFIIALQKEGKKVAMVGDGINDAQALARADLGIAMGKGADIAMDVAKIILLSNDLRLLPKALKLSEKTLKTIKQNLFWAFVYNVIGIPVAAGVLYPFTGFLLSPMLAGAAMALSSVSVVTNSLRLRSVKL